MGNKSSNSKCSSSNMSKTTKKHKKTNTNSSEDFIIKLHEKQKCLGINLNNDEILLSDQRRIIFISLIGLYKTWDITPTSVLYSSIFMLPLKREWVYSPTKYKKEIETNIIEQISIFQQNSNDLEQFISLLKWKDSQKLLFWMLDEYEMKEENYKNDLIAPFWRYFNDKLTNLYDPITNTNYNPINFDEKWWKCTFNKYIEPKYNVKACTILCEFYFVTMKYKSMQEILYQSNAESLNPIISYQNIRNHTNNLSPDRFVMTLPFKPDHYGFLSCNNSQIDIDENQQSENEEGIWMISMDYDEYDLCHDFSI